METPASGANVSWLRLMRKGNCLIAHCSRNGTDWKYVWFNTIHMSSQVEIGIAVTAHSLNELATATVDNVTVGGLTPLPGVWPHPHPQFLFGGEAGVRSEWQRVGDLKLLVAGSVGDEYRIRFSPTFSPPMNDANVWPVLIDSLPNPFGVVEFLDPDALTTPQRFYRAEKK